MSSGSIRTLYKRLTNAAGDAILRSRTGSGNSSVAVFVDSDASDAELEALKDDVCRRIDDEMQGGDGA